jgi:hypothetical protein
LVAANKEVLIALRTNFDKPEIMKEQFKRLQSKYCPCPSMLVNLSVCFVNLHSGTKSHRKISHTSIISCSGAHAKAESE